MINVQLNAQAITVESNLSLAALLHAQGYQETYFAVALNRRFVSRSEHAITFLQEGDQIEIIFPMQGG
ncbi:sulfur carrier protein ThiS [Aquicella lusitana]|uniref:Sulfur carrier protein n=1 Tax=Aquicella lusitana TaxID=254246 RepID=A0A370GFW1_9COXI|nr:sulfur carrier protein ThiS [Aquicella lusitana]RDI42561.1 sulfur carrier protein [Aquicella lusitana]VVC74340.1 hypothetical protein AQULUS_21050 [Aquicella lusitana]